MAVRGVRFFEPGDEERQRQDFLAGAVPAARAGVAVPEAGTHGRSLDPLFAVFVHEDSRTFGAAPVAREVLALLDEVGGIKLAQHLQVHASWAALGGPNPLVKLRLCFRAPVQGRADLVLSGVSHARLWHYAAHGALIAVTSMERIDQAASGAVSPFASLMQASVLLTVGASPTLIRMISVYGWPPAARSS
ncbi:hypothetical protein ACSNOH_28610 [Streptomyces sp. URMC 127]|uniref:hypothetical protein n=1 Tax=Streptomyces sp. URMC 127 TaxID=3423402 RepID=UPI003F1C91D6